MDADLERLEVLSLVKSISQELLNHVGISDAVLAEFLIQQHVESKDLTEFRGKLKAAGADLPESFISSMDRLVLGMHPKFKKKKTAMTDVTNGDSEAASGANGSAAAGADEERERQRRLFPGLSLKDSDWMGLDVPKDDKGKGVAAPGLSRSEVDQEVDSMMAELDSLSKRRPPQGGEDMNGNRKRGRSRSISPPRREERRRSPDYSGGRGRDDGWRGRERSRDGGYGNGAGPSTGRGSNGRGIDEKPVLYKIYNGRVSNLRDFGAFVALEGVAGKVEGMVHIGSIGSGRVNHPSDLLTRNQPVKVKVMSIAGGRLGLSMKDVDQSTGRDLTPHLRVKTDAELAEEDARLAARDANGGPPKRLKLYADDAKSSARRLTSPERWELKQLIASGAAKASDYPDLDEDMNVPGKSGNGDMDAEEELDIEVRDEEAPFLAGQTRRALELSPVKIIKAPDGSMNRAAMAGASLAKERRELKQQEANDEADSEARDLNTPWLDPMMAGQRQFAQDARGSAMGQRANKDEPAWKKETSGKVTTYGRITSLTMKEQREGLPIYKLRNKLIQAVKDHQILVVVGDTGSGKTTQMTQYLAEEGFAEVGKIACTQPRRVAAMSVAKRVAEEVGCRLGQEVGYTIRFEDCTGPETKIKYMTDGMLQREALVDPEMSQYSVVMLDEAHERTIATDVLFGLLKKAALRRPDLKIIVTSATLDAEKFSRYFRNAPIFTIPGRMHPVEVLYTKEPESDYLDASLMTVMQIHLSEPQGDILLFLTGQEEIDTSCEILFERMKALGPQVPELIILPVYGALPSEMQSRIFDPAPPGTRKVIIATNIAETSLTIDGIYYVIDPGFAKQNAYDPRLGMDSLIVTPISQAQANQRKGRAGRTGPGKCYRLYTEAAYKNEMLPNPIPDIQRTNLAHTILMLKAMGINDLLNFDFMDPPPQPTLVTALENLYALSALDDEGLLTPLGRKMCQFPMEPPLAKMLIASIELGCSEEILTIVAMLSAANVFYRPKERQAQADAKKALFNAPEGDHITLLNVYNGWKNSKFSNPWCMDHFIQARSMRRAQDVRKQLLGIMDRYKHDIISCGKNLNRVRRAIVSGYFRHAAKKDPQEGYKTLVEGTPVYIHPSSALFQRAPEWVVYHDLVLTTREYMREVTAIEPKWLQEMAPTFFKIADANNISKRKKQERIAPLWDRYAQNQDDWRLSKLKKGGRTSQTFG